MVAPLYAMQTNLIGVVPFFFNYSQLLWSVSHMQLGLLDVQRGMLPPLHHPSLQAHTEHWLTLLASGTFLKIFLSLGCHPKTLPEQWR